MYGCTFGRWSSFHRTHCQIGSQSAASSVARRKRKFTSSHYPPHHSLQHSAAPQQQQWRSAAKSRAAPTLQAGKEAVQLSCTLSGGRVSRYVHLWEQAEARLFGGPVTPLGPDWFTNGFGPNTKDHEERIHFVVAPCGEVRLLPAKA